MSDNVVMAIVLPTLALVFGWAVWVMAVNVRRSRSSDSLKLSRNLSRP